MKHISIYISVILFGLLGCSGLSNIIPKKDSLSKKEIKEIKIEEKAVSDSLFFDKKEDVEPNKVPVPEKYIETPIPKKSIRDIYMVEVGTMESTGNNDGPGPKKYLRSVGLKEGFAYCSAFVRYCFDEAGVYTTITAWSPTAENRNNIIYKKGVFFSEPEMGDVVTFYYPNLGRIGHTGFYDSRKNGSIYKSVEANTSSAGTGIIREGQGVFIKYRSFHTTNSISRWIKK